MIELVMVILLLVILAAVISVSFQGYPGIKLNSAIRRLASDIRYAQQLAMTRQGRHGVIFNQTVACAAAANTYTVFQETGVCADTPFINPYGGSSPTMNYNTDSRFQGVTITGASFCAGVCGGGCPSILEFNALGIATDENGTQLTCGTVTLNYSGASRTITVAPSTGKITY
jgi:type II secretory pathway pseudopilin PulG